MAFDMLGSVRSGAGALRAALDAGRPTLAVLSDIRTGLPGGTDEREGGDGAVAFLCGDGGASQPAIAELLAWTSRSAEFLERWRLPGDTASRQWEERFGEHAYVPLGQAAVADALKVAGVGAGDIARLIVAGPHARACRASPHRSAQAGARPTGSVPSSATRAPRRRGSSSRMRSIRPSPGKCSSWSPSPTAPTPWCGARPALPAHPAGGAGGTPGGGREQDLLRVVSHLARPPRPRAAAPAGSPAAGGAVGVSCGGVEVRLPRVAAACVARHLPPSACASSAMPSTG